MLAEFLYQISGRDEQISWLETTLTEKSAALANVLVAALSDPIPERNILVLTSASISTSAGVAQSVSEVILRLTNPTGSRANELMHNAIVTNGAGATMPRYSMAWSGMVYIPPSWSIQAFCVFSAGANTNTVNLSYTGIQIPLGNVQRN